MTRPNEYEDVIRDVLDRVGRDCKDDEYRKRLDAVIAELRRHQEEVDGYDRSGVTS